MEKLNDLRNIREARRLTRDELAKYSGVSKNEIKALELGYHNVDNVKLSTLISLANVLKCKVIDLLPKEIRKKIR